MYTLGPETIKYADRLAVEKYGIADIELMRNAARSCVEYIMPILRCDSRIVVLCGKGNNGGDGYEIARILHEKAFDVTVVNVFGCEPNTETAKAVFKACVMSGVKTAGQDEAKEHIKNAHVIVDALFGVGFYGSIDEESEIGRIIKLCNEMRVKRVAVDVPSGINSADGRAEGVVFDADITLTMAYIKTGMLSYPAREYCGDIKICDIGYPDALCEEIEKDALVADDEYVRSVIPVRKNNTHKGSYGRLVMCCGCSNMTGAAVLAAEAALRSGVGLVNIVRDENTVRILQTRLTEPVFTVLSDENAENELLSACQKASAILVGCGMGLTQADKKTVFSLIKNVNTNLIIDADGINALSENTIILREAKCTPILTPHPLEFSRLTGMSVSEIQSDRINAAKSFAREYGCVVVLKGAGTVIAAPDGRVSVNTSGNAGLAKGGSGDVLAGLVASLCAQGIEPFDAAVCGCYLHGKAADVLKEEISEYGLLPSDLPMAVAKLLP